MPKPIQWRIDARDVIDYVSDSWDEAARQCGGPTRYSQVLGTSLWSHIQSDEVEHLYKDLIDGLRANLFEVHFPIRCDTAETDRILAISAYPEPDGSVLFESRSVFERQRSPAEPLDVLRFWYSVYPSGLVRMCAWCSRIFTGAVWVDVASAIRTMGLFLEHPVPPISHTICEDCFRSLELPTSVADPAEL